MLIKETFTGSPHAIGLAHGRACRQMIASNLTFLVQLPNPNLPPPDVAGANKWFRHQRDRHYDLWPWLAEEIRGIAQGSGLPREMIEKLNFRIWQYGYYGKSSACASFAAKAGDGTLITGGFLDDPRQFYFFCEVQPKRGFRYMSFPIAGTCWANRGVNETGLSLGTSSLPLAGLRFDPALVYQQDLCMRVILQTCRTVAEVRELCRQRPFFMNVLVVDGRGDMLSMAVTADGPKEYPTTATCLTNHPLASITKELKAKGYTGKIASKTSVCRLRSLAHGMAAKDGKLTVNGAKSLLADRTGWPLSANNPMTAFATISHPERCPKSYWVSDAPVTIEGFKEYRFK